MKTEKGIVINSLGNGGVSIRCEWYQNPKSQNIILNADDIELLPIVIKNLFTVRDLQNNIYKDYENL